MNAQTLILGLVAAHATTDKKETCNIVLSKLKTAQKERALPRTMLRRAIKIMEKKIKTL